MEKKCKIKYPLNDGVYTYAHVSRPRRKVTGAQKRLKRRRHRTCRENVVVAVPFRRHTPPVSSVTQTRARAMIQYDNTYVVVAIVNYPLGRHAAVGNLILTRVVCSPGFNYCFVRYNVFDFPVIFHYYYTAKPTWTDTSLGGQNGRYNPGKKTDTTMMYCFMLSIMTNSFCHRQ